MCSELNQKQHTVLFFQAEKKKQLKNGIEVGMDSLDHISDPLSERSFSSSQLANVKFEQAKKECRHQGTKL